MADETSSPGAEIIAFKGFDQDLKCRGFQYAVGETYEHDGAVKACSSGFHACEHPLNVFSYYQPSGSRFAVVRMSGEISRDGSDTKIASAKITIDAEIGIPTLVQRAIEWVIAQRKPEGETATGTQGAASSTGNQGAASSTGYRGRSSAMGKHSVALAAGFEGYAKGDEGCVLSLIERADWRDDYRIISAKSVIVGREADGRRIKPDTWYSLRGGKVVEVTADGEVIA